MMIELLSWAIVYCGMSYDMMPGHSSLQTICCSILGVVNSDAWCALLKLRLVLMDFEFIN